MNQPKIAGIVLLVYTLNLLAVVCNPISIYGEESVVLTLWLTNMVIACGFLAGNTALEAYQAKRLSRVYDSQEEI